MLPTLDSSQHWSREVWDHVLWSHPLGWSPVRQSPVLGARQNSLAFWVPQQHVFNKEMMPKSTSQSSKISKHVATPPHFDTSLLTLVSVKLCSEWLLEEARCRILALNIIAQGSTAMRKNGVQNPEFQLFHAWRTKECWQEGLTFVEKLDKQSARHQNKKRIWKRQNHGKNVDLNPPRPRRLSLVVLASGPRVMASLHRQQNGCAASRWSLKYAWISLILHFFPTKNFYCKSRGKTETFRA